MSEFKPTFTLPELTAEQLAHQAKINGMRKQIDELEEVVYGLVATCAHVYVPSSRKYTLRDSENKWTLNDNGAICLICQKSEAWYCEESPTNLCEYAPEDNTNYECLHCHGPEERK